MGTQKDRQKCVTEYVTDGMVTPKKRVSGNLLKLSTGDLQLAETLNTLKPSILSKSIKEQILLKGNFRSGISNTAIRD